MLFNQNEKIVMIGDSITDTDRARPIGEGAIKSDAWGKGYVGLVKTILYALYPELSIRIVNMGISGNRIKDLEQRWQTDVLDLNPNYVSVMIGVNDVWRHFDKPQYIDNQISLEHFKRTYEELIIQTKDHVKGMFLFSPFFLELNKNDPMRKMVDSYSLVVKELCEKHSLVFIDVQKKFDDLMKNLYNMTICSDRVHPSQTGHFLIAKAFLDAIGADFNRTA